MAEFDPTTAATGALDAVSAAGQWIVWSIVVIAVIIGIFYILQFKQQVIIRPLGKGTNKPITDKARIIKKDGARYWKLLKRKELIPFPPAESLVSIGNNKYYCEFSWSEEDGYVPLVYDIDTENFSKKVLIEDKGKLVSDAFQPFTPQQRAQLVGQLRRAESRRKKTFLDTLTQLATPMMFAMLLIAILLFWEDLAKPAKEMALTAQSMQGQNAELLQSLAEISEQNARMTQALTGYDLELDQQIRGES